MKKVESPSCHLPLWSTDNGKNTQTDDWLTNLFGLSRSFDELYYFLIYIWLASYLAICGFLWTKYIAWLLFASVEMLFLEEFKINANLGHFKCMQEVAHSNNIRILVGPLNESNDVVSFGPYLGVKKVGDGAVMESLLNYSAEGGWINFHQLWKMMN